MDIGQILDFLVGVLPVAGVILQVLGSLVVLSSVVVALTPSQDDDAFLVRIKAIPVLGALVVALERFSVVSRKE